MTKVKMSKDIHMQMRIKFAIFWKKIAVEGVNSIKTALGLLTLRTGWLVSYKTINWFLLTLPQQIAIIFHICICKWQKKIHLLLWVSFVIIEEMASSQLAFAWEKFWLSLGTIFNPLCQKNKWTGDERYHKNVIFYQDFMNT